MQNVTADSQGVARRNNLINLDSKQILQSLRG